MIEETNDREENDTLDEKGGKEELDEDKKKEVDERKRKNGETEEIEETEYKEKDDEKLEEKKEDKIEGKNEETPKKDEYLAMIKKLHEMKMPCVEDFLKEFMPGFEVTLDELNEK
jgi:hypothetical protein